MDKDRFYSILCLDGMDDLQEWLEKEVRAIEEQVLRYDLHTRGTDGLAFEKCKAEGARKVFDLIRLKVKEVKAKRMASLAALSKK